MEKNMTESFGLTRRAVFDREQKKRFEQTFEVQGAKAKKSILVVGLNPASSDIKVLDTTTVFILNNLLPMGYTTITVCNLYAELCKKLKPSEIANNRENRAYIREVLKRKFDTVLIGFGNTFTGNKFVTEEKKWLKETLTGYSGVMDLVDEGGKYARLRATHPLMAGRYYPGQWKLRPYHFENGTKKGNDIKEIHIAKSAEKQPDREGEGEENRQDTQAFSDNSIEAEQGIKEESNESHKN